MDQSLHDTDNLLDLFEQSTDKFKNNPFLGTKNKTTGEYEWVSYGEVRKRTDNLRGGLAKLGVTQGDTVGIIANNRTEWAVAAFATYGLRARYVPMYRNEILNTWHYITENADTKVLLVATHDIYKQVLHFKTEMPKLEHIYIIEAQGEGSMAELEAIGAKEPVASVKPKPNDTAALIYTSGTTGDPKGVLLSHGNLRSNSRAGGNRYHIIGEKDCSLSILPWAHSYGQVAELYNWLQSGGAIGFMESVDTLGDDLGKIRPTFLIAVPRVFNKIYDGIGAKMKETGGMAEKLYLMGLKAAKEKRELAANGKSSFMVNLRYKIADKVVFKKFRARFGGRVKASITASAKMNVEISQFFRDIGVPVYDCYGLSETSPAISMNAPDQDRLGSVGKPLEQVKVRIDKLGVSDGSSDGEIQVSGPNVMQGYFKKEKETAEVMTEDGWLRTGDRGMIDEDGFIWITGRIKEQYKLANGKYVFPAELEEDIRLLPYIENAMVYGDGKDYNVCLIIPDCNAMKRIAAQMQVRTDVEKLIHSTVVQEFIGIEIRKSLEGKYGKYEIPKKFLFVEENFSIENGMLTQTLKLKRREVLSVYDIRLNALYEEE